MSSQPQDLHRALLRPAILHILRGAGFHGTKPSVLDTLVSITERYLMLLASTTARHAINNHNEPIPTVTDVRMALTECGVFVPFDTAAQEAWKEIMRPSIENMGKEVEETKGHAAAEARMKAEKRKREDEDLADIRTFVRWFDGPVYAEMRRVAGMTSDATAAVAGVAAVGVGGGGVVQAEDFLTGLKKKFGKSGGGEESRLQGTVLGIPAEDREVVVEGGPVQRIREWRPKLEEKSSNIVVGEKDGKGEEEVLTEGVVS